MQERRNWKRSVMRKPNPESFLVFRYIDIDHLLDRKLTEAALELQISKNRLIVNILKRGMDDLSRELKTRNRKAR